jgi:hypothetical protein
VSKSIITITMNSAAHIKRGMLIESVGASGSPSKYVVKHSTATTLTVVPYRWWHRIPWMTILSFMIGCGAGYLLNWWLTR